MDPKVEYGKQLIDELTEDIIPGVKDKLFWFCQQTRVSRKGVALGGFSRFSESSFDDRVVV